MNLQIRFLSNTMTNGELAFMTNNLKTLLAKEPGAFQELRDLPPPISTGDAKVEKKSGAIAGIVLALISSGAVESLLSLVRSVCSSSRDTNIELEIETSKGKISFVGNGLTHDQVNDLVEQLKALVSRDKVDQ